MSSDRTSMHYMEFLDRVVHGAVALIREKTKTYGPSWKKRGGAGAWFTIVRPWDRLENIVDRAGGDVIAACLQDVQGADGSALACVRDIKNYLILVEAEVMARSVLEDKRPGTPEDGGHHGVAQFCATCGGDMPRNAQSIFCSAGCANAPLASSASRTASSPSRDGGAAATTRSLVRGRDRATIVERLPADLRNYLTTRGLGDAAVTLETRLDCASATVTINIPIR